MSRVPGRPFVTFIAAVCASVAAILPASATTLFTDSLQSTLGQWNNPISSGEIVAAPDGGDALTFDTLQGGSNLLTTKSAFTSSTGSFTITFDIYANCGHTSGCGAFLDTAAGWILSDTSFSGARNFADSSGWETVSYTFSGTSTTLAFEDWNGSPYAQAYPNTDAIYIRNLTLTNNQNDTAVGTLSVTPTSSSIPEPASLVALGAAILGISAGRIGFRRTAVRAGPASAP